MAVSGLRCAVTGGCGFVGHRLVEMLVERGAARVVAFDVAPAPAWKLDDPRVQYVQGDITKAEDVDKALQGIDCVWHVAALVGPYHPKERYTLVNYHGTLNIIEACRKHGIKKVVMSSSPSTRMDGTDLDGVREDDMRFPETYLQDYAESKAAGERALTEAQDILSVAIAPHQVYGPHDALFLSSILSAAESNMLRKFGNGQNRVAFTHVDNYCHGLILGYDALYPGSPCLGKFYVVTDGGYVNFWDAIDQAVVGVGYTSINTRASLPYYFIMPVAYLCNVVGWLTGTKLRLTPFTVKMLTIHRWFDISNAKRDLKYEPLFSFEDGWRRTIEWFKNNKDEWHAAAQRTGKVSEAKKM